MSVAHVYVDGVVQGVSYRYFCQVEASRLGLTGWAKNLPDGRVELEIVGDEGLIKEYLRTLKIGPPSARVTTVNVNWIEDARQYTDFSIRY